MLKYAKGSVHGSGAPRLHPYGASVIPGCVSAAARPICSPPFGNAPPGLKCSPWRLCPQPPKHRPAAWAAKSRCPSAALSWLRDRLASVEVKPHQPDAALQLLRPVVAGPTFQGLNPELILLWLEDAWRKNVSVRTVDLVAALNELRCTDNTLRDPRYLRFLEQACVQFRADPAPFTNRDLVTMARNLAKAGGDVAQGLDRMEGEAIKRVVVLSLTEITGVVWAFATAGRGDAIFGVMGDELAQRSLEDLGCQELANLAWAFARAGVSIPGLFTALERELVGRQLGGLEPQELPKLVWAYSTAGVDSPDLFLAVDKVVVARGVRGFDEQGIVNLVWAFATAGKASPRLFAAVQTEMMDRKLEAFTEQGIADMAWAFAKAGVEAPRLLAAIGDELLRRQLGDFTSQALSNLVWAFASAGQEDFRKIFRAGEKEVAARGVRGFDEQGIVNLVWAFATAGMLAPELFAAVEAEVGRRGLQIFNQQGISDLAWAFAKVGREAPALFGAVEGELLGRGLNSLTSQSMSSIVWAFAMAGKGSFEFFSAVEAWVLTRALRGSALAHAPAAETREGHSQRVGAAAEAGMAAWVKEGAVKQEVANMLWALAVAGRADSDAGRVLLVLWDKLEAGKNGDLRSQLKQVCQYILACVDASDWMHARYCSAFLQQWQEAALEDKRQIEPLSSDVHRDISSVLQGMGTAHENEVPYFHGLTYVDILVNGKVAVEVDGPAQFYRDTGATTAATLFKRRLLERGGFQGVSIPLSEWDKLKGGQEKEKYLRQKLQGLS